MGAHWSGHDDIVEVVLLVAEVMLFVAEVMLSI